jgi:hypothetical protein
MATKHLSLTRYADQFHGNDASAKIVAAIADLPSIGGTVDCSGFVGTQALTQNIFAGLGNTNNKVVEFKWGNGQFYVTESQVMSLLYGVRFIGNGPAGGAGLTNGFGTQFIWDGPAGGDVFVFDRTRDCVFENFGIIKGSHAIGAAVRCDHLGAPFAAFIDTNNRFRNVSVYQCGYGFQVGNLSTQNNSEHCFRDCYVDGATNAAYYISHSQAKNIKIQGGSITGSTFGVKQVNGSFQARDVIMSGNGSDFAITQNWDTISIVDCYSESAQRFLVSLGGTAGVWPIRLVGNSWAANLMEPAGTFISFGFNGGLFMAQNNFQDGAYNPLHKFQIDGHIFGRGQYVSIGNAYANPDIFAANPAFNQASLISMGDSAWDSGNNLIELPIMFGSGYNNQIVLVNGANNDIPIFGGDFVRITGPTGAFSISGFLPASSFWYNRRIKVFNTTSQQMTIKNLSGSSSNNQIQTLTGGDVTLRAGQSFATFVYDPYLGLNKWILESTN